ncbi:unnamed protein product [Rhizophagus irregularis]|uniref:Uncharacterized protein n=1 Tax=Rhizophagus irregularis TaxID=588596 RepID=A0A915ZQV2_9GLOM|nr:unnamed protein product [Rhizophagus irregularis]
MNVTWLSHCFTSFSQTFSFYAGKRLRPLSLYEPTESNKINKISFESLLELGDHFSADEEPVIFVPFIPRLNIQESICNHIYTNIFLVYGTNRKQDYQGIIIYGGNGVGKTRIGFEIENFIAEDDRIQRCIETLKVNFKHIFINMREILDLLGEQQIKNPEINTYPRIPKDIEKAVNVLNMCIAIYFFAKVWTKTRIMELMPEKSMHYKDIIYIIRKNLNLDRDSLLVLILQIDEFQFSSYWTTTFLRIIADIVETDNMIIITVCTGTAPSKISALDIICASQYRTAKLNLPPMNLSESSQTFNKFIRYFDNNYDADSLVENNIYISLVNAIRGIPMILEIATRAISEKKSNVFESYDVAKQFWDLLCNYVKTKYSKGLWLECLGDENNVILLLYFIHTQSIITKKDKIFGSKYTIEEFEIVDYFNLNNIFDKLLLSPFTLLNEESFPKFMLRMHQATYGLANLLGISTITFTEIYGGNGICSNDFRNREIQVKEIEYYEHSGLIPKEEGKYDEFFKPGLNDRKNIPVVCSGPLGYKEIDITLGKYLVLIARRTHSVDALTPHGDEQYKYSLALESGHPIHTNSTGEIDINILKNEAKKTLRGCERFILISPKTFIGDRTEIPENCAVVAGEDLLDFISPYAILTGNIATNVQFL